MAEEVEIGIRHAKTKYPRCLGGARACPPEDCGGPPGYAELRRIIAKPAHREYENMTTWLGGTFDPAAFVPGEVRFANPKTRLKQMLNGR